MRGVDYYELLGVTRGASATEIKSAYRSLARVMHPDAGGTSGTFRMLQEAYETLSDPVRRARYDGTALPSSGVHARPRADNRRRPGSPAERRSRMRDFGEDPAFVPPAPRPDPADLPWWHAVDPDERIHYVPATEYGHTPVLGVIGGWLLLLPGMLMLAPSALVLTVWLVPVVAAVGVLRLAPYRLPAGRTDRAFTAEFGARSVFGEPGAVRGEIGEQLTAEVLSGYFTRLPGVRIFHGLSWPGSVFADVDHAVLCGRRLVLIESKMWLPGHYTVDDGETFWRNGRRFRGGATRLPEGIAAYRELLPAFEVRGALVLYPSRAGELSTAEHPDAQVAPMVPEQFVREIGGWLSREPATVDRDAFRTVLGRVLS